VRAAAVLRWVGATVGDRQGSGGVVSAAVSVAGGQPRHPPPAAGVVAGRRAGRGGAGCARTRGGRRPAVAGALTGGPASSWPPSWPRAESTYALSRPAIGSGIGDRPTAALASTRSITCGMRCTATSLCSMRLARRNLPRRPDGRSRGRSRVVGSGESATGAASFPAALRGLRSPSARGGRTHSLLPAGWSAMSVWWCELGPLRRYSFGLRWQWRGDLGGELKEAWVPGEAGQALVSQVASATELAASTGQLRL